MIHTLTHIIHNMFKRLIDFESQLAIFLFYHFVIAAELQIMRQAL